MKIYKYSYHALEIFKNLGFLTIVITNQSGIGRGYFNKDFVEYTHAILKKKLHIDDFFYCPHTPEENCSCRKPKISLIEKAKIKHNIELSHSYFIGDSSKDVNTAINANITPIQVLTGYGRTDNNPLAISTLNVYTAALLIKNLEGEK